MIKNAISKIQTQRIEMKSGSDDSRLTQARLKGIDGRMDNDHLCMNEEVPGWSRTIGKGS